MSVLIVGADGSMGKRYQAVLRYLNFPFICADSYTPISTMAEHYQKAQAVIIATPTAIHKSNLDFFSKLSKPILCEKPLSKDMDELIFIRDEVVRNRKSNLTMMMQYEMLTDLSCAGESYYDYFRHGNDGLAWDCLQVIALAKRRVTLKEESPVWKCEVNGQVLSLSDMDRAYVEFVKRWMARPGEDISRLFDMHLKVMEFKYGQGD